MSHGLIFLPVVLSYIGPMEKKEEKVETVENNDLSLQVSSPEQRAEELSDSHDSNTVETEAAMAPAPAPAPNGSFKRLEPEQVLELTNNEPTHDSISQQKIEDTPKNDVANTIH